MAATTLYRSTRITFDGHYPSLIQPWFALTKRADDMARSGHSAKSNVVRLPGAGWVLKPYVFDPGKVHETTVGQDGIQSLGAGLATLAPSFVEKDFFRQSGLLDVAYTGAPSSGSPMWQKRVEAGASFDQRLSADQSAYPSPATSDDVVAMDRAYLSSSNFEPDDTALFRFFVPGSTIQAAGAIATLYFTGPAGSDSFADGCGQYALKLFGDGLARLYERQTGVLGSSMWTLRDTFRWAHPQLVFGTMHQLCVGSDAAYIEATGRYVGRRMFFRTTATAQPTGKGIVGPLIDALVSAAILAIDLDSGAFDSVYHKPGPSDHPAEVAPVRVDLRRDVRAICQVSKGQYPTEGELKDDQFTMGFPPTTDLPLVVEWYASTPSGCTVDVKVYDADTDVELTGGTTVFTDELGGQKSYTVNSGQDKYYAKAFFTGPGDKTPLLSELRFFRDPLTETPDQATTSFPQRSTMRQVDVTRVSVTGPGPDPSHETCGFGLQDYVGYAEFLKSRSGMPVKVDTTYDSGGVDRTVLFRGYVSEARGRKRFTGDKSYPYAEAYAFDVTAMGEWRRLAEQLAPKRFSWYDQGAQAPYKITEVVRTLLGTSGYPASMIDVPDLPLRLFSQNADEWVLEPGSSMADVIVDLARDYLGAYMVFDPNAGADGMWRLLQQKTAPYNVLARFEQGHPGDGIVVSADGAYGTDAETSPLGNAQTVVKTFVRKGTLEQWVVPPEGNIVTVYGYAGGPNGAEAGQPEGAVLSQTLLNVRSYNFFNLDPAHANYPDGSHADYLGRIVPIKVYDPSLQGCEAVNWVCKRVYQAACFAQKYLSFEAPLILVTDADDAEQTNPRPLRFYDAVEAWNPVTEVYDTYVVASCNPTYTKDRHQMAHYELLTTTNIADFASA